MGVIECSTNVWKLYIAEGPVMFISEHEENQKPGIHLLTALAMA